jgi:tetratricopeptide (TPR) repeat protein
MLAATQIPKPADEQAFERACVVLWRGLLNDPSVQRNGRRGQRQNGVDLFGIRDGNADWHVGIQCKLKSEGHYLSEDEVRSEVRKALTFKPALREYYVITTSPDDVAMQELAREITRELANTGKVMRVFVWGWNTLEERISEDAAASKAFDPSHTLFGEEILAETRSISSSQTEIRGDLAAGFSRIESVLAQMNSGPANPPGDSTVELNAVEMNLDAEIDEYRELNNSGKTLTALPLLERLLARVGTSTSGRIRFRIEANIGYCLLALGRDDEAAAKLIDSFSHAPSEPKAIANKAFGLLLQGKWKELLAFGKVHLDTDPSNEWLAGYIVQAARFDTSKSAPLELVPEALHQTASVQIGWVDFVRRRGQPGEWWEHACTALATHPTEQHLVQFAAEAVLDEILTSHNFQRMRVLSETERRNLEAATETLSSRWEHERGTDGPLRPEGAALCGNLMIGLAALDEFPKALHVARQGLALSPDDMELLARAASVAVEADDFLLAGQILPKLPVTSENVVLKFRYHASQGEWSELVELFENNRSLIPAAEEPLIRTAAKLAAIRIGANDPEEQRRKLLIIADDAARDPRASIVVADFARRKNLEDIADIAFKTALTHIDEDSHAADRLMVADHASRRGDAAIVADLLDGRIAEDHDSEGLQVLARAFVSDNPIRHRALAFFARLPQAVRELPYYRHATGVLHYNRGALTEAEAAFRGATTVDPNLDNYIALFSILYRLDRGDEVKALVDGIDLATVKGSPGQKMFLAQVLRKTGQGPKALAYAYSVLQTAKNDQKAVLRYFGLIMLDPDDGLIPPAETVAVDTWVRLETDQQEHHAFLIEEGLDRPADDIVSPAHPMAMGAIGLRVGGEFEIPVAFGETRRWRVAEIKHKFLHALHEVMESFENRFPDANGFYRITTQDGDIQPVLNQVRRVAESNRERADFYLKQNCPMSFVTAKGERDAIRFAEYIRFLNFDIRTCLGTEPERLAARDLIEAHRTDGIVLDAYTAWTVSTMDAFDVLQFVFRVPIIPQTVIDEIKTLRDEQQSTVPSSMTITWHNGQYVRQEYTAEDIAGRRDYIVEQLTRIEAACDVKPVVAPDDPTEVAVLINQSFGTHLLDAANLAGTEQLLVSEDMHYRQFAEAACSTKAVWLQTIFSFALEKGLIDHRRYVDLLVKLAWRRHGHLSLTADNMLAVVREDHSQGGQNFEVVANFIGTQNADHRSHVVVSTEFLNRMWQEYGQVDLISMRATSTILDRLIRFRSENWALILGFLKRGCSAPVRQYIDRWIAGHFLPAAEVETAMQEIENVAKRARVKREQGRSRKSVPAQVERKKGRVKRR